MLCAILYHLTIWTIKKREKHPWRSVAFSIVTLIRGCFSLGFFVQIVLNCVKHLIWWFQRSLFQNGVKRQSASNREIFQSNGIKVKYKRYSLHKLWELWVKLSERPWDSKFQILVVSSKSKLLSFTNKFFLRTIESEILIFGENREHWQKRHIRRVDFAVSISGSKVKN